MNNIIKFKNRQEFCGQCGDCRRVVGIHKTEDDLFYNCDKEGLINIAEQVLQCKYFKRNAKYVTHKGFYKKFRRSYPEVSFNYVFDYGHGKWKWKTEIRLIKTTFYKVRRNEFGY